jgi:hypothetical protein
VVTNQVARGWLAVALWASYAAGAAGAPQTLAPLIPPAATQLQGTPTIKIEVTQAGATRHTLSPQEAAAETLSIRVRDGRLFWSRAGGSPLTLTTAGEMTYLSSPAEPGRYVRLRKLNDRLTYVEHLDLGTRSVTYWGEVRIGLDKGRSRTAP